MNYRLIDSRTNVQGISDYAEEHDSRLATKRGRPSKWDTHYRQVCSFIQTAEQDMIFSLLAMMKQGKTEEIYREARPAAMGIAASLVHARNLSFLFHEKFYFTPHGKRLGEIFFELGLYRMLLENRLDEAADAIYDGILRFADETGPLPDAYFAHRPYSRGQFAMAWNTYWTWQIYRLGLLSVMRLKKLLREIEDTSERIAPPMDRLMQEGAFDVLDRFSQYVDRFFPESEKLLEGMRSVALMYMSSPMERERSERGVWVKASEVFEQLLEERLDEIEGKREPEGPPALIGGDGADFFQRSTGIGHFQPGSMYVIGGLTGAGKTTLLFRTAVDLARKGKTVLFVSTEMTSKQLIDRHIIWPLIRRHDQYTLDRSLMAGTLKREWAFVLDNLIILEPSQASQPLETLLGMMRRMINVRKVDLIVIDYLQRLKLHASDGAQENYGRVSQISGMLKDFALQTRKPLLVAAQLNRAYATRQDNRARLSDLRDSGAIEQDADMVALLWGYEDGTGRKRLFFEVPKNRFGSYMPPYEMEIDYADFRVRLTENPYSTGKNGAKASSVVSRKNTYPAYEWASRDGEIGASYIGDEGSPF